MKKINLTKILMSLAAVGTAGMGTAITVSSCSHHVPPKPIQNVYRICDESGSIVTNTIGYILNADTNPSKQFVLKDSFGRMLSATWKIDSKDTTAIAIDSNTGLLTWDNKLEANIKPGYPIVIQASVSDKVVATLSVKLQIHSDKINLQEWDKIKDCFKLNTANDQIVGVKNAKALSNNLVGFDGFTVGSAITSIGDGAFSNCTTLSKEEITPIIKFAGKVTSIGADAFWNNKNLLSVIFEDQAGATLKIDEGAFDGCSGLSSIQLNSSANDATISIGSYAFNNCVSLKGFTRGTTDTKTFKVTAIDTYAFSMCPNLVIGHLDADPVSSPLTYDTNVFTLKNDTDPKTNKIHGFAVVKKDTTEIVGCLAIGNWIEKYDTIGLNTDMKTDFQNCAALTDIKLAANISIIKNAFRNCTHLKTINLAGDIKSIGTSAFRNCGNNNSTLTPGKITGDIKIEQKNTFFSNAIAKKLPADKWIVA